MPSVNFNFIALLLGLAAVVALYFSALSADQEIAKTKERAAQLEKEAATLRKQLSPRTIDREKALTILAGRVGEYEVVYGQEDVGSQLFANQIRGLLDHAGWKLIGSTGVPISLIVKNVPFWPMCMLIEARDYSQEEDPAGSTRFTVRPPNG